MDPTAILNASNQELTELGIEKKGDIISLRSFVRSKLKADDANRSDKKRNLLDILRGKIQKKSKPSAVTPREASSSRKIKLGKIFIKGTLYKD